MRRKEWSGKATNAIQLVLIYGWLSLLAPLADTDTYYSIYILIAILSLVCREKLRRPVPFDGKGRTKWGALVLAACLSLAVVLANYTLLEPWSALQSKTSALVLFAGGICVTGPIIRWVAENFPLDGTTKERNRSLQVFLACFGFIALVDLGYLFGVKYPGILTRDSVSTVKQILGMQAYNNVMPYWHTKLVELFFEIGMWLTGDINGAVATFHVAQIAVMAASLSYAVMTVYQLGAPHWGIVALLGFYGLVPYHIAYSVTLWKDVPFAGMLLLMTVAYFRMLRGIGKHLWLDRILAIVGAVGFALLRTNGWYALAVTVLVMGLCKKERAKPFFKQMVGVLLATWFLLNPLLKLLHVEGMELTEAFAVPMQQIARVVSQGRMLEEEDIQLLEEIFDVEQMAQEYTPGTVDSVKFNTFRYEKKEYIRENWEEYLRLYLKIGLRYPADYGKAWIELTKGFWNAGYVSYIYDNGCEGEELGIFQPGAKPLAERLYGVLFRTWEKTTALQFTAGIGLFVWVLIVLSVVALWNNWEEKILFLPLLVLMVGLWLGTPVSTEFRYGYPFALCAPFLLCACGFRTKDSYSEADSGHI